MLWDRVVFWCFGPDVVADSDDRFVLFSEMALKSAALMNNGFRVELSLLGPPGTCTTEDILPHHETKYKNQLEEAVDKEKKCERVGVERVTSRVVV